MPTNPANPRGLIILNREALIGPYRPIGGFLKNNDHNFPTWEGSVAACTAPPPAKLSPPRLLNALPRERLFAWLDAQRACAGIWIGGPPGAGKSTLVASYLNARHVPSIWYRMDQDDNDAGQFFSLLGQSAAARPVARHLPRFSPEHLQNIEAYARSFFRALFSRISKPLLLVLDNTEQARLPNLPLLIAVALSEAPAGVTVVITSRMEPRTALAEPATNGSLALLPREALAFTTEEARAYATAAQLDEEAIVAAAQRFDGWAAGLRLASHGIGGQPSAPGRELLLAYFASAILNAQPADCQRVLAICALLPFVPVDVAALVSGVANAGQHLEHMRQSNLFTERLEQSATIYRFHPLFREFLQDVATRTFTATELADFRSKAAQAFAGRQEAGTAIDLFLDAKNYGEAGDLLLFVLEGKLAAAQLDQVTAWLVRFPPEALDAEPRLLYGWGRACFLREDAQALIHYEHAEQRFARRGDLYWQQLCAAGVLEWNYNTDSFLGHQRWCDILLQPLPPERTALCDQHALRLSNGRLLACFFAGDFPAEATAWINDVLQLLSTGGAENEKLSTAITLLGCLERHKRWDEATLLAGKMESLLASAHVGPRLGILVRQQIAADLYRQTGAYREMCQHASATRLEAREHGFSVLEYESVAILLIAALCTGDDAEAKKLLADLARLTDPGNIYHQRFMHQMQAWQALQQGNLTAAREHADALRAAVLVSDMPPRFRATWLLLCPYVTFAEGNASTALAELSNLIADAEPGSRQMLEANLLALQAWHHLQCKDEAAAQTALTRACATAAGVRYYQLIAPLRDILACLAMFAIENGIAPVYTTELISRRCLMPPPDAGADWPWAVRISTLGGFEMTRENEPIQFAGKAQHKPLELLKLTIALNGRGVDSQTLVELLWPDADGDDARSAFGVTLFRLRKLLGRDDALTLQDGKLSLNPAVCWVDAWAFERLLLRVEAALRANPLKDPAGIDTLADGMLQLYRGHFLGSESESWALAPRERLRSKFLRHCAAIGKRLELAGHWEKAARLYERVLELDPLAEEFYRHLMICHRERGHRAEAMVVYRRCREMLSIVLGILPSPETQAVFETLSRIG